MPAAPSGSPIFSSLNGCHHSYRQAKYNLLREDNEGYSKLVVELLSNMGPPHDAATGLPTERSVVQRVKSSHRDLLIIFDAARVHVSSVRAWS